MAEIVSEEHGPKKPVATAEETFFRHRQREMVVNQRRFGLAYLVLAIGVGVAVGLGIVLVGRGTSHHKASNVTVFHPTRSGELGARQIANHVGYEYRQVNGDPLVTVVGERPTYQYSPLLYYLIRPVDARYPNDIDVFLVGNGIMYSMNGTGANGIAPPGVATPEGATLLKREALELSFDTFKTDSAVDTVTTLLPQLSQSHIAIIFRRSDLRPYLSKKLSDLLEASSPIKPGQVTAAEARRIDHIEVGSIYTYEGVEGADGTTLLRIAPVPYR